MSDPTKKKGSNHSNASMARKPASPAALVRLQTRSLEADPVYGVIDGEEGDVLFVPVELTGAPVAMTVVLVGTEMLNCSQTWLKRYSNAEHISCCIDLSSDLGNSL